MLTSLEFESVRMVSLSSLSSLLLLMLVVSSSSYSMVGRGGSSEDGETGNAVCKGERMVASF